MQLKIYNTLTRKKEDFVPLMEDPSYTGPKKDFVGIYSCGPTVYSTPHIGNFKASFAADLIRNVLQSILGYRVISVMNFTDVGHLSGDNEGDADHGEDRLEKGAKRDGITARDVAKRYEGFFMDGLKKLNIDSFTVMPRATDHIQEQINLVKILEDKGYTYKIDNDGIYMDTSKIEDYGKLMGANYKKRLAGLQSGFRVEDTGKKNPSDFALWKFSPVGSKRDMERESPRGLGFPGRHIECSAMSSKYLGEQFDIHHGGPEHITVHHSDEIAQSECAFGHKPWVKYRVHHGFLTVDGGKMGKSLGNGYTIQEIIDRGFSPLDMRMFYFQAQYSTGQDFTWNNLESAKNARHNLTLKIFKKIEDGKMEKWKDDSVLSLIDLDKKITSESAKKFLNDVVEILLDDLNTAGVIATINKYLSDLDTDGLIVLHFLENKLLKVGLFEFSELENKSNEEVPENIKQLADDRVKAKQNKDYKLSDELRDQIKSLGYDVKDGKDGYEVIKL